MIPRHISLDKIEMVVECTAQHPFPLNPFCLFSCMQTNLCSFHCKQARKSTSSGKYSLHLYTNTNKVDICGAFFFFFLFCFSFFVFFWLLVFYPLYTFPLIVQKCETKLELFLEDFPLVPTNLHPNPFIALGTANIPWVGILNHT